MADKAENENQGTSGGGERRAALRTDEPGSGFTRLRESGFPMRKASTLPDVSAYSNPAETPSPGATDRNADEKARTDDGEGRAAEPDDDAGEGRAARPNESAGRSSAATDTVAIGVTEHATGGSGTDGPRADDPTADPSSPATHHIAATPDRPAQDRPAQARPAQSGGAGLTGGSTTATGSHRAGDDAAPDTSSLTIRPPEDEVHRRASQRDEAVAAKPMLPRVLQVAVAVFFPVILLAAAVRAVTTPLFLWAEYHRPGFPADSYGFSTEDRMTYGSYAMDYILNWAPPRFLGDLVNTEGEQLFLDSEVGHMADVKGVLSTGFVVATVLAILAIAACVYLARRYPGGIRRALFAGAVATLVLAVALAVAGILAWETFFTQVHALFFADGTWTFRLDDTLIRLFPAQFWIDAAATVGAIVLIGSVLTLVLTWPTKARREKSARAYEVRRANSGL